MQNCGWKLGTSLWRAVIAHEAPSQWVVDAPVRSGGVQPKREHVCAVQFRFPGGLMIAKIIERRVTIASCVSDAVPKLLAIGTSLLVQNILQTL